MSPRALIAPLLLALTFGCGPAPPETGAKSYPIKGTVIGVDVAARKVTLAHEEIPGFMPAMTMPFVVRQEEAARLGSLSPGDHVTARLVTRDSRYWLEDLVVVKKGAPEPAATPDADSHVLEPGDALPDVALVNQDGDAIRLADYRGRALAVTFVYTRCPLPTFCPLIMKSFTAAHAILVADQSLRSRTHLLTVSFDTEHDVPEVLRRFGAPFQKTAPPFTHWELATGREEAIRTLGDALGLDYLEEEHTFTHNLRTAVVDPEGRLYRLRRGGDWTPAELVADLRAAAG